jgi:hypothetical protein
MKEQEKSLKLAELMGWETIVDNMGRYLVVNTSYNWLHHSYLTPYGSGSYSLAQFAAILLANIQVTRTAGYRYIEPTQANILDEILRMNGVEV